ncbi:MAG: site-specific integrase [Motiliproteus sp.]|nr:site-specific integrase [Motiliproteus sp.]
MNTFTDITAASLQAPEEEAIHAWLNLPQLAKSGHTYIPSADTWRPDNTQPTINVLATMLLVPEAWQNWLVAALVYRLRERKQNTMAELASLFKRCGEEGLSPLVESDLLAIRERFRPTEFGILANFITFWHGCDELALRPSDDLIDAYANMPRKKKTGRCPVASLDPIKGPFTPYEEEALFHWVCELYVADRLPLVRFAYMRLIFTYGARNVNFQQMVFGDIQRDEKGAKIQIPKAKSRNGHAGFRHEFHGFCLSQEFYQLLAAYKRNVLERLKQEYPGRADWDLAINNVPLFRRVRHGKEFDGSDPVIVDSDRLKGLEVEPDSQLHAPVRSLRGWVLAFAAADDRPISERTRKKIHINPHRFRYSVGTDMAREGYSKYAIAAGLTQKDSRSVGKYIKTSLQMAKRIDAKLKDELAPMLNAFNGTIVSDRQAAYNGERADRQIEDLAVCGSDSQCHLDAPLTCYPCAKFQPLLHGDHQRVLEELELRQAMAFGGDQNTAQVYDRAILACRRVIHDCQQLLSRQSSQEGVDS